MPAVGRAALLTVLVACQPLTPCQQGLLDVGSERAGIVTLTSGETEVIAQVFAPPGLGRYPDGAPVAVYIHGSWATNFVPLDEDRSHLNPGLGVVQLYLNLPGGQLGGGYDASGADDRRGAATRSAVALALRYADDTETDADGCRLSERLHTPLSGPIVLAGYSNGGNLAWATLGDPDLDLPEVAGVVTYETPAAGQLVVVESGTEENESPVYVEGACGLEDGGILCDYDYTGLAFDEGAEEGGVLFIDQEGDGTFDAGDFRLGGVLLDGRWHHSLPAREAAIDQGLTLSNRATPEDTRLFWLEREAPRQMAAAAARFPGIAGIASGSARDHVLTGAVEHPHISGMIAAMVEAGVGWHRLHPDAAYTTLISRASETFPEYPANMAISVGEDVEMLPTSTTAHGEDYLSAATVELLDRAHDAEWAEDLDAILHR